MARLQAYLFRGLLPAFIAAIIPSGFVAGQNRSSTLDFKQEIWDFGKIEEADGPVSHTFEFTNTGDNAIVIERVSVSCGCTTPEYSREPVLPGKKGSIKVTYDPAIRPGYFSKDIYVISNNGRNNDRLIVRGEVKGKPRTVEQDYPYLFADRLRLDNLSANFRYVTQASTAIQTIGYANVSSKPVKLEFAVSPDDGIVTAEAVDNICAGCKGEIKIRVRTPQGKFGKMNYKLYPVVNGVQQKLGISVTAIATEDFSQVRNGEEPSAKVNPTYQNLGTVKKGAKPSYTFTVENTGTSPLVVRSVLTQEGISTDLAEGTSIAPGKSAKVKCTLDTRDAPAGTYTKIVTLILNDPARPMRELRLAATVE
ncbi:MAG: DUF1573 domain-containing protein [Alistipes sp.]|nr:DUF1573 domain-containing protein [Alistipes sp.]